MSYQIHEEGGTWTVTSNGVPFMAGLTRDHALKMARDLTVAAIAAEAEESEDDALETFERRQFGCVDFLGSDA